MLELAVRVVGAAPDDDQHCIVARL